MQFFVIKKYQVLIGLQTMVFFFFFHTELAKMVELPGAKMEQILTKVRYLYDHYRLFFYGDHNGL